MLIFNGTIHTMAGATYSKGYVLVENDKISALGEGDYPGNWTGETWDAQGGHVTPGLIDAHCHLGLFGESLGVEGEDGNESTDPCTPHLRGIDAIHPFDRSFEEARQGGVTTVATGPGSANPISGQFAVLKTQGTWVDKMIVKAPIAMKFAFGENPKFTYHDRRESPTTRMAIAGIMREQLSLAKEYLTNVEKAQLDPEEDAPDFDAKLEALLPVLRREMPVHFHAHRGDDILTGVRVAQEFNLDYVIVHGTEGHLVANALGEVGARVITGPNLSNRSKPELQNLELKNPAVLKKAGVEIAICTDHPVIPIQYLPLCAGLAVKGGLSVNDALEAITIAPARILGLDKSIGSLEVGKEADIAVFSGHPLELLSNVTQVLIGGKSVL